VMSQVRGPHRFGGAGLLASGQPKGEPKYALNYVGLR